MSFTLHDLSYTIMHVPVLLQEVIDGLLPKAGDIVVDGTLGGGGHALALGGQIGKSGVLIGIDEDGEALKKAEATLKSLSCRVCLKQGNFRNIDEIVAMCGENGVDAILFDLGVSSLQLEESGRGFSFKTREPLLMTMNVNPGQSALSAYEIVNYWSEKQIAEVLSEYGEERNARKIAKAIVDARKQKLIGYANELADIVESVMPHKRGIQRMHSATKTFQALRIAVNDELNALSEGLANGFKILKSGGKFGIISFHSLEDRIVKHFFKLKEKNGEVSILTKKPIIPSRGEVLRNSRARSAKLRIAQKI